MSPLAVGVEVGATADKIDPGFDGFGQRLAGPAPPPGPVAGVLRRATVCTSRSPSSLAAASLTAMTPLAPVEPSTLTWVRTAVTPWDEQQFHRSCRSFDRVVVGDEASTRRCHPRIDRADQVSGGVRDQLGGQGFVEVGVGLCHRGKHEPTAEIGQLIGVGGRSVRFPSRFDAGDSAVGHSDVYRTATGQAPIRQPDRRFVVAGCGFGVGSACGHQEHATHRGQAGHLRFLP